MSCEQPDRRTRSGVATKGYKIVVFIALAAAAGFMYFVVYRGWFKGLDLKEIVLAMASAVSPV